MPVSHHSISLSPHIRERDVRLVPSSRRRLTVGLLLLSCVLSSSLYVMGWVFASCWPTRIAVSVLIALDAVLVTDYR